MFYRDRPAAINISIPAIPRPSDGFTKYSQQFVSLALVTASVRIRNNLFPAQIQD